jgi:hypothetical protein
VKLDRESDFKKDVCCVLEGKDQTSKLGDEGLFKASSTRLSLNLIMRRWLIKLLVAAWYYLEAIMDHSSDI